MKDIYIWYPILKHNWESLAFRNTKRSKTSIFWTILDPSQNQIMNVDHALNIIRIILLKRQWTAKRFGIPLKYITWLPNSITKVTWVSSSKQKDIMQIKLLYSISLCFSCRKIYYYFSDMESHRNCITLINTPPNVVVFTQEACDWITRDKQEIQLGSQGIQVVTRGFSFTWLATPHQASPPHPPGIVNSLPLWQNKTSLHW